MVNKEIPNWLITTVVSAIAIALVLIILYFSKFFGDLSEKQDVWGQFGDYVGGILNPLLSLTALFSLLHTVHLQSKELRESTEQLRISAKAFKKQNEVSKRQQFETTFFQMLTLFNEIINSIETTVPVYEDEYVTDSHGEEHFLEKIEVGTKIIKGRKRFNEFYN